ncbi:helix-turn-helix transcriptional regulator [Actinoallomurus iriomotensis]|uniref:Helix-turn-helix transcriptional regulator n=1 Tax=Actinoallomurus iriomotensis TaxID=478107 RepID=A0A9W6RRU4_9ACTN|nr:AAA family ATPase [Actinoallomurus iriomotensis]GLY80761.1 helix-turn-helix transcriptional regulator [Actinoallomurus iriomotensis]
MSALSAPAADLRPPGAGRRGRDREWRVLTRALCAAEGGRGGVVLVDGQSGMGKTRLLAEAAEAAADRGFTIARGGVEEPGRLEPLAPLTAALGESTQTLLASVANVRGDAADLRLWLVQELQARLERRAAHGPLLVTLDDLHWADPTTLLALRTLIPELASYPLVWILSRTTGSGDAGVDRLYEVLEREGATRMRLAALDDRAVAAVVADVLGATPDAEVLELAAGAGGNPFILVELLGGLLDESAVEIGDGRARLVSRRLPLRVQETARRRLGRLSAHCRRVLQVAAVLGRSFDVNDLADMLGELPSRLLPAVEEAEATGVVVPDGDLLAFRHDLLWRAMIESMPESARRALHRQAAGMLLERGGSSIRAAAHLLWSARPGDPEAVAGLDRAVREVLPSSPQTAADLAVRALELTGPSDAGRFDRTVTAVYALSNAGRLADAIGLARAALDRATRPRQAAQLRYELAYTLLLAGRAAEAVTEAERVLEQRGLPDELRGVAEQVLFRGMFANHDRRGHERAEAVVAAGERHGPTALVGAHMLLSSDTWAEGRCAEAIGHVREATRIAADGPIKARHAHPRLHLISLLTDTRQIEEAENALRTADEEITALGHTTYDPCPAIFRGRLRLAQSRLDDAATEAQAGLGRAEEVGAHAFDLLGFAVLALVAVLRGDIDAAVGSVERYESSHRRGRGATYGMRWGDWAVTRVVDAQAGATRAMEEFHSRFLGTLEHRRLLMTEPNAAAWLTRTALAAGERPVGEALTAMAETLARGNPGFRTYAASAAHARGILDEDPEALARAAATYLEPWSRASAAEDLGVLRARTPGAHEAAIHHLDEALTGYRRVGAARDAARVRARLREFGVRRRNHQGERPASGWAALTDTERAIAALVAEGLTNPQVATRMFISPHTVKFHLGQAFRKLGIGSRVELARLVAEHAPESEPPAPE